jgi:hypothetical protein
VYLSISVDRLIGRSVGFFVIPTLFFVARWFGFSKKTGLSPLAPGQWKGFLAVYAGFYVFNNFVRPMRLAASVGVAPYFEKAVNTIQRKTKLSKGVSVGIVVFLANVCGTTSLMSLGIYIASLAAGIPIFPPKV